MRVAFYLLNNPVKRACGHLEDIKLFERSQIIYIKQKKAPKQTVESTNIG